MENDLKTPEDVVQTASNVWEQQTARVYASYQETLQSYQAVDFDDLIRLPAVLLQQNSEVRNKWQRRLRYLLVDECQDTNTCQFTLMKLLTGAEGMFTAVGDDDQSIYAWRGANMENLRKMQEDYPQMKVIKLEQNYRSTARILKIANKVIENNPKLFTKKTLVAVRRRRNRQGRCLSKRAARSRLGCQPNRQAEAGRRRQNPIRRFRRVIPWQPSSANF